MATSTSGDNESTDTSASLETRVTVSEGGNEQADEKEVTAENNNQTGEDMPKIEMEVDPTNKPSPSDGPGIGVKRTADTDTRSCPKATKRRPDKELNHDNWDEEDEPEEQGEFKKATMDQLKERKIITAKRKHNPASKLPSNPFGSINLRAATTTGFSGFNFGVAPAPAFDFSALSSNSKAANADKSEDKVESKNGNVEDTKIGDPSAIEVSVSASAKAEEPPAEDANDGVNSATKV